MSLTVLSTYDPTDSKDVLLQSEAEQRSEIVSGNVGYNVSFLFNAIGSDTYRCIVSITFRVTKHTSKLWLDFAAHQVHHFLVNGKPQKDINWRRNRLYLPPLRADEEHVVHIDFTNHFSHDGDGFHRFCDPHDSLEYLYTNLEPFHCHHVFPCFDQPDLRGVFSVCVEGPAQWEYIANGAQTQRDPDTEDRVRCRFGETACIPTYIFALIVGPYAKECSVYTSSLPNGNSVPLAIYCRQSLLKHLNTDLDELFGITCSGMAFYENYFRQPYPFTKYDQIMVPEFNAGAMENAGAVTFLERYVFKGKASDQQRIERADTILHEMAHMWFGNAVSPKWWNGLWLNESFATVMAAYACAKCSYDAPFMSLAWSEFATAMKHWAYSDDQMEATTHSIESVVGDTDEVFLSFDGISYGKGASALKQLMFLIGEDVFRNGLRIYFERHLWQSTTMDMFLTALQDAVHQSVRGGGDEGDTVVPPDAAIDISKWSSEWICSTGLNEVHQVIEVDQDGTWTSIQLKQSCVSTVYDTLRTHKVRMCIYSLDDDKKPVVVAQWDQVVSGAMTAIPISSDMFCSTTNQEPLMLFSNVNDNAYLKLILDSKSLEFAANHIIHFTDSLMRQQLWYLFVDAVRDARMPSYAFLRMVHASVPSESSPKLLQFILSSAMDVLDSFIAASHFEEEATKLFRVCWSVFIDPHACDAILLIVSRYLPRCAVASDDVHTLVSNVERKASGDEGAAMVFQRDTRYRIVQVAIAHGHADADELFTRYESIAETDSDKRSVLTARASVGDARRKASTWAWLTHADTIRTSSMYDRLYTLRGWALWHTQSSLMCPYYVRQWFETLPYVFAACGNGESVSWVESSAPWFPEDDTVTQRIRSELQACTAVSCTVAQRVLSELLDKVLRARKAIAYSTANWAPVEPAKRLLLGSTVASTTKWSALHGGAASGDAQGSPGCVVHARITIPREAQSPNSIVAVRINGVRHQQKKQKKQKKKGKKQRKQEPSVGQTLVLPVRSAVQMKGKVIRLHGDHDVRLNVCHVVSE